jgi:hypothetical protein
MAIRAIPSIESQPSAASLSAMPLGRPFGLPDRPFLYDINCSFTDQINGSGDFTQNTTVQSAELPGLKP